MASWSYNSRNFWRNPTWSLGFDLVRTCSFYLIEHSYNHCRAQTVLHPSCCHLSPYPSWALWRGWKWQQQPSPRGRGDVSLASTACAPASTPGDGTGWGKVTEMLRGRRHLDRDLWVCEAPGGCVLHCIYNAFVTAGFFMSLSSWSPG